MSLIKTVYEVAKIALRYGKRAGRFTSGETAFIRKFPPGYRKDVQTILKGAATVTYGGLASDIIKDYMLADDSPGNGVQKPFNVTTPRTPYKTRYRQSVRTRDRNSVKCYPRIRRRQSRSRKSY